MNCRERVITSLQHLETDRIPLSLGGTASSFTDQAYFRLKEYLGIRGDVKPYRYGHTGNYYDDRILDALGTDYRYLVLSYPDSSHLSYASDGTYTDEWGIRMQLVDGYASRVGHPLKHCTLKDLGDFPWPDPHSESMQKLSFGLKERARFLFEEVDCAIVARAAMSASFLEYGAWLCGYEEFLMYLVSEKELAAKVIDKILNVQLGLYEMLLAETGDFVQIVETAEDFGTQASLMISPRTFREMILPARKKLNQHIRSLAPNAKILHHTCGAVENLIPDLIESGIDILNPIQPTARGMNSGALKLQWGDMLCFDGAIDTQIALPGPIDGLEKEIAKRIMYLAPSGGYSLGPSNHLQEDVPPANVVAMYEIARDLGRYPIDIPRLENIINSD